MTIEIFYCEQRSAAWYSVKIGLPSASRFHCILARGEGKTRRAYLYELAAEIITGNPTENFQSFAMARGKEMEDEARAHYALMSNTEPRLVGFIRNGDMGASPDSLIGEDGMLEIKTQRGDLLIETLLKDEFPLEHRAQTQGNLLVSERDWIDISIYWPGMPRFIKRAYREPGYLISLQGEIDRFNDELAAIVAKLRAYGGRPWP
jgi:hypothetical protein